jgi:programmed cell death 8 (apoptosis-inducing factor)
MTRLIKMAYNYKPAFWSEVGNKVSFQGIGLVNSEMVTVGVWSEEDDEMDKYEHGVVFYMGKDKKVKGVLLWNLDAKQESVARRVLASGKGIDDVPELARMFQIFPPSASV